MWNSVFCQASVDMILLNRNIKLDWNLPHVLRAQKDRTSSLSNHFWTMVLVVSVKIKNSIFWPKSTSLSRTCRKKRVRTGLYSTHTYYLMKTSHDATGIRIHEIRTKKIAILIFYRNIKKRFYFIIKITWTNRNFFFLPKLLLNEFFLTF